MCSTCCWVIKAFLREGNSSVAKKLLDQMTELGLSPDRIFYTTILEHFCKFGNLDKAYGVFNDMIEHGITPDVISFNALISGLCRVKTFEFIIGGLILENKLSAAYKIWDQMMDKGFTLDRDVSDTLIKASCSVDESTSSDESPGLDLPDGLLHFRNNLLELLVDICQLLHPTTFVSKLFFGGLPSSNISMSLREIEAKLFALNAVSEIILQEGEAFDFSLIMQLVSAFSDRPSSELKGFMCCMSVYRSLADVIGSFSRWISVFPSNGRPLLLFLAGGISEPICSHACASALRKICEDAPAVVHETCNLDILMRIGEVDDDVEYSSKQSPAAYTRMLSSVTRGLYRIGTVFSHLATSLSSVPVADGPILSLLTAFWPILEKLVRSEHMESGSLAAAACRALSVAVQSSGFRLSYLVILLRDIYPLMP
ncbi:hypothetical protein Bca52824_062880 [Brassica carinata]|uniref:Pentatricopeptide repeat-containing protein n=1 Tax=Brassica carinata TaxID=52824 RepID=A0A8X7QDP0_BRACI|nr:hypothetical protein Bca52824_062880 [Brassica carinata]